MSSQTILKILAFFSIYVFWGSTYLLNKIAVTELPPFMLAATRFISAGMIIFFIAKLLGLPLKVSRKQLYNSLIAGFLFLTYGNGVFVWALKYVDSGFAALLVSTQPLVVLIMMWLIQGKKIEIKSYVGVFLGVLGIYLLLGQKEIWGQEGSALAISMMFTCIISWGLGSLFVGKADLPPNFFINAGYQMILGGSMMAITSLLLGEIWISPMAWNRSTLWSILGLIIFGSILAFTSFNYLLKVVSPEKVATSTYINPIIALLLGWYFLQEQISFQSAIAAFVLLSGVYFINSKSRKILPWGRSHKSKFPLD